MEDNIMTITPEQWELNSEDSLWYVHVKTPFECDSDTETIMELSDEKEYTEEHKEVFDALNNGYTGENEVVISCKVKPDCDIKVLVKTLEDAGGRIVYDKDGNPEYIPEDNGFGLLNAFGMMGSIPTEVTEAINNVVDVKPEENKEE